ncbi:hypothetical protein F442_22174 [Phytophthora nicotianae P10297]|uniref:Uncharacterized protein n=1 Tax=Phytophthora nicotianae P10297 TaxID=1317064 RepID=W2Y1B7_PHYNI|nr:hypothetical protein F442_22174 [Phytophthora nicotianae P10297]
MSHCATAKVLADPEMTTSMCNNLLTQIAKMYVAHLTVDHQPAYLWSRATTVMDSNSTAALSNTPPESTNCVGRS